jgi:hypothetical protein
LNEASAALSASGVDVSAAQLREYGFETGLVRLSQFDSIRPLHDSFADYLSAVALWRAPDNLPDQLLEHDRARVRFLAGLGGLGEQLAALTVRDLPLTAVSISREESRSPTGGWFLETHRHLDQLLPPDAERPQLAFWRDSTGRTVLTVDGDHVGWWDVDAPERLATAGWAFVIAERGGPLQAAIRVWHRYLTRILKQERELGCPTPKTLKESKRALSEFSDRLQSSIEDLMAPIGITGPDGARLVELAETRMQFLISGVDTVEDERNRSVWYREVRDLGDDDLVLVGEGSLDSGWTGWGSVDSFITKNPLQEAKRNIIDAINRTVGRRWL